MIQTCFTSFTGFYLLTLCCIYLHLCITIFMKSNYFLLYVYLQYGKTIKKRNFSAFSRGWLIELLIQLCCALLLQKYILEMLNNAFDNSTLYLSFFVTIFISFDNDLALCFGDFLCRLNQDILENICP